MIFLPHIYNRRFWIAETIFTLVFLIFLKSQWFFLNYLCYLEPPLTVLENYRITAFEELQPLIHSFEVPKSEKNNNKEIDK